LADHALYQADRRAPASGHDPERKRARARGYEAPHPCAPSPRPFTNIEQNAPCKGLTPSSKREGRENGRQPLHQRGFALAGSAGEQSKLLAWFRTGANLAPAKR
jgi:hypothetical protein